MDNSTPFRTFGTMLDCSRNAVPNLHTLKKWVDLTASLGYNTLLLYTEATYEVPDEPYFGYIRGRYSQAELRELDAYAKKQGMTIMPCIQTLAHLYAIKRWPEYWPHFDTDDILLAGDERVYTLIDHMFRSLAASLSCRTIHLGMDEAEMFARGRYYNQHGDCNRSQALLAHLQRVCVFGETSGRICALSWRPADSIMPKTLRSTNLCAKRSRQTWNLSTGIIIRRMKRTMTA